MLEALSIGVVGAAGAYLVVLGVAALVVPARAARFLLGFASTRRLHVFEILCRVLVGASLVTAAPSLSPARPFTWLGALLLGTSAILLLIPWRWHQRFAARTVPRANRFLWLVGIASLAGGAFTLVAVLRSLAV